LEGLFKKRINLKIILKISSFAFWIKIDENNIADNVSIVKNEIEFIIISNKNECQCNMFYLK